MTATGGTTTFEYDGDGSLVAMTVPGSQQPTYYFGPLVERTASGTFIYSYFLGSTLIARRSTATTWYHDDHLGSVRLITDAQGNAAQTYTYSTYGVTVAEPTQQLDEFGFTSQRRNPSTAMAGQDGAGLIYMNARFYDATLGRFISPDTVIPDANNPQSLNRYAYARNNPISYSDPTGYDAESSVESDSFNPEDPVRYNHRGLDPWATEIANGLNAWFMSSLDGSTGSSDALQLPVLQCTLCISGFTRSSPSPDFETLTELLTEVPGAWATLDEYLQLVPKDESAIMVNGSLSFFRIAGGFGLFVGNGEVDGDEVGGTIQMGLGAFDFLKSALTSFGIEGVAEALETANPVISVLESYYKIFKMDADMNTAYYGPGNTPWEQHGESYLEHELRYFFFLENPAPMPPPPSQQ